MSIRLAAASTSKRHVRHIARARPPNAFNASAQLHTSYEAPTLDFLYPSLAFVRSFASAAPTDSSWQRPRRRWQTESSKCSCGRIRSHTRAALTSAAATSPERPTNEQAAESAQGFFDSRKPRKLDLTGIESVDAMYIEFVDGLSSVRGRDPQNRHRAAPLDRRREQADMFWDEIQNAPRWGQSKQFATLDNIRMFARFCRDVLPPKDEAETQALDEFRRASGDRIAQLLARARCVPENSLTRAYLELDTFILRDAIPSISPPNAQDGTKRLKSDQQQRFHSLLNRIFNGLPENVSAGRTIMQHRRTIMWLMLEAFERLPSGPTKALDFVYGWRLDYIWRSNHQLQRQHAEAGFGDLYQRRYGNLLARLSPSPREYIATKHSNDHRQAVHVMHHLALADQVNLAYAIFDSIKGDFNRADVRPLATLIHKHVRQKMITRANEIGGVMNYLLAKTTVSDADREVGAASLQALAAVRGRFDEQDRSFSFDPEVALNRMIALDKNGQPDQAELVFRAIISTPGLAPSMQRRLYTENVRINARRNKLEDAMMKLNEMVERELSVPLALLVHLLEGFAERVDVETTYALFDQIPNFGHKQTVRCYNALIFLHVNAGDVTAARRVLDRMRQDGVEPTLVSYTMLMNGLVEKGFLKEAFEVFEQLENSPDPDLAPDTVTVNVIIKAAVLSAMPAQEVVDLFRRAVARGFLPDGSTYTGLLQSLCSAGQIRAAEQLFDMMQDPPKRTAFGGSLPTPLTPIRPNAFQFSTLMHGYLLRNEFANASACLSEMQARGLPISSVTYSIIVDSFLRSQTEQGLATAVQLAREFVNSMPSSTSGSLLAKEDRPLVRHQARSGVLQRIVNAFAVRARAGEALQFFRLVMEDEAVQAQDRREPDVPLYTSLMIAYQSVHEYDEVKYLWRHVSRSSYEAWRTSPEDGSPVDRYHANELCLPLTLYIDTLTHAVDQDGASLVSENYGEILEEWLWLSTRGFGFNAVNWNTLGVSASKAMDVDRAFNIAEHVLLTGEKYFDQPGVDEIVETAALNPRRPARMSQKRRPMTRDLVGPADIAYAVTPVSEAERSDQERRLRFGESEADTALEAYEGEQPAGEDRAEPEDAIGQYSDVAEVDTSRSLVDGILERAHDRLEAQRYPHYAFLAALDELVERLRAGQEPLRRARSSEENTSETEGPVQDQQDRAEQDDLPPALLARELATRYPRTYDALEKWRIALADMQEGGRLPLGTSGANHVERNLASMTLDKQGTKLT